MKRSNWIAIGMISSSMLFAQKGSVLPNLVTGIPAPANILIPGTVVIGLEPPSSQISPVLKLRNELIGNLNAPIVIASIGESYAAGEGNPNHASGTKSNVRWQPLGPIFDANGHLITDDDGTGVQCHHSLNNGPTQAALALNALDGVDINFATFACSGATIDVGLTGRYGGIDQGNRSRLPAQIDQLQTWLNSLPPLQRRLDVLLISVGGNDMGFGDAVRTCLNPLEGNCGQNSTLLDTIANGHHSNDGVVGSSHVRAKYAALQDAINGLNPKPRFVVITTYPDLVRDSDGVLCDSADPDNGFTVDADNQPGTTFGFGGSMKNISHDEARFLADTLLATLNSKVSQGAGDNQWKLVDGMTELTHEHGYCSHDRWFNTLKDAFDRQGDIFGTAHPNLKGHAAYKHLIVKKLVEILNLSKAPAIEVNLPEVRPVLAPFNPSRPFDKMWQVSVEIAPTAYDVDVQLQFDVNQPDATALFNPTTLNMQRDPSFRFRQVYSVQIPDSNHFTALEPWHFRVLMKYGIPGKVKTNIFIGRTYSAIGSPNGL
jgi:hypothetical protein